MNKILTIIAFLAFVCNSQVKAQDEIDNLLKLGVQDANTVIGAYIDPFTKGFGSALGNGWYNTAKAHKTLGFDLTITANAAYVPDEDLFFNLNDLNLQTNLSADRTDIPTLFGSEDQPEYQFSDNNGNTVTFDGPGGLAPKDNYGLQAVPVPMVQLGIGIVKNTDLKIRWTPEIDFGDDGSLKVIGFAVMHDVKQHIPGIKDLPFDLSVLIGFTDLGLTYGLADQSASANAGEVSTLNGEAVFDVNTWTYQAIISKKLSVLTLYGALGFNAVKTDLNLRGTYEINDNSGFVEETLIDPIAIENKESGARLTAGMRLKLAVITLHADYTLQKYNTLTVGFGINVR